MQERPEHQSDAFQVFFSQPHEQQQTPLKHSFIKIRSSKIKRMPQLENTVKE